MENEEKLVASSCDHMAVIEAIAEGIERVNLLRELLLPVAGPSSELAGGLFREALRSFSMALSELNRGRRLESSCSPAASVVTSPPSAEPKTKNPDGKREDREVGDKNTSRKRRRTQPYSWPTETCIPHYDGHQWRKYGQKDIRSSKYPRSYYRCTFRDEQGCQARKTVQQKDDGSPPKFIVTYDKQHTCKPTEAGSPIIVDTTLTSASTVSFQDSSLGSLGQKPSSSVTAADKSNSGLIPRNWDPAGFVTTTPKTTSSAFSPPSHDDGSVELMNYINDLVGNHDICRFFELNVLSDASIAFK